MHRLILLLIAMMALYFPVTASAGEQKGTVIALSAQAEASLPNDQVVIHFRIESEGKETERLRKNVDRIADEISRVLKKERNLKYLTTGRRLDPLWSSRPGSMRERTGWRMVQTGRITSTELDGVSGWLESIEKAGARLNGLQFQVSDKVMLQTEESLQMQAVAKFRRKAAALAKSMDAPSFRVLQLQTDGSWPSPPMQMERFAMADSATAAQPALESGESTVSVRVSGSIELPLKDFPAQ